MKTINIRRSIRKFQHKAVEQEKIEELLKAGMQAPSAGNQQLWEFIIVQNDENRSKLSGMSPYALPVADAPLSIVLIGNRDMMRYPENWEQDMGACAENILLEAVELGLGGVWLGVTPVEDRVSYIRDMFKLSQNRIPYAVLAIGYPAEGHENRFIDRYDPSRVFYEKI